LKKQKGFSLIELLIVVAIILIIAAIAIPNLLRARIAANESSAVSSLRTINTAEVSYTTAYPNVGYSAALVNLGPGGATCPAGGPTQAAACLVDNVLAGGAKSGYTITETGGAANAQGIVVTYETEATPQAFNQSGVRGFCSIEDAVIRWEANGTNAMGAAGCPALTALQ
jgi:prepilin-type N-terminal cleavage/methylation domain-containing protein